MKVFQLVFSLIVFLNFQVEAQTLADSRIDDLRTFGNWSEGDKSGVIRIIISSEGFDHLRSHLIIEWLEESIGKRSLYKSIEITEFEQGVGQVVSIDNITLNKKSSQVHLVVANTYSNQESNSILIFNSVPGNYKLVKINQQNQTPER